MEVETRFVHGSVALGRGVASRPSIRERLGHLAFLAAIAFLVLVGLVVLIPLALIGLLLVALLIAIVRIRLMFAGLRSPDGPLAGRRNVRVRDPAESRASFDSENPDPA